MKKTLKNLRFLLEYIIIIIPYHLIRLLPRPVMRWVSYFNSSIAYAVAPGIRKLICANLKAAFPEKDDREIAAIARKSFHNTIYNFFDFIWMMGKPKRIEKYTHLPPHILTLLRDCVENNIRILFVNPHLGSWEGSGIIATNTAGVKLAAIAKVTHNPYLNDLLNKDNRERGGIKIIFSKGAIKDSLKCLHEGYSVGLLIDQNTRIRDGGAFVNMFGLPVASSRSPAMLWHYCEANQIPVKVIYGTTLRTGDKLEAHFALPAKAYHEYANDDEILQELMDITEGFIRQYPDQYLWLYKRFQYIPPDAPEELKARYPFYARVPEAKFFRKRIN